jgi:hypothetical protein
VLDYSRDCRRAGRGCGLDAPAPDVEKLREDVDKLMEGKTT